jgi:hypothetical protein
MEEQDIQQRFQLLQKEIEATASLMKDAKIDLAAAIGSLRLEIEALKMFMQRHYPEFSGDYAKFKSEAMHAIDPEWVETKSE